MRTKRLCAQPTTRVLLFLLWILGGCLYPDSGQSTSLPEYQVKAVLIYKMIKFIDWPDVAFSDATSPFNICVLGPDPFGDSLKLVQGKQVRGRQILAHKIGHLSSMKPQCHALFISSTVKNRLHSILKQLDSQPILTLSDNKGFARAGSMVNFVTKNNKIRFEINLDASRRAGLKISAQLLELAIIVSEDSK